MTPEDALDMAVGETKAMTYDHPTLRAIRMKALPDTWQTPDETLLSRKGLCRDFAIYACHRMWELSLAVRRRVAELAGGPLPEDETVVVLGHVDAAGQEAGRWHAWVELISGGTVLWGETTPGYHERAGVPWEAFPRRIPRYAQAWDGEVLDEEYEYRRRGA